MKTSLAGVNLIKSFEGLSLTAYTCPAGVLTVGYGHTGPDVTPGKKVTEQQAEALLKKDLIWAEDAVTTLVKIPLNQNQFDALVSFTYNSGKGALELSSLLRRLNNKEDPCGVVKDELPKWCHGDGAVLPGLVRRRAAEVEMFCQAPAQTKTGLVDITSLQQTWFKKNPVDSAELPNDQKAKVYQGRTIRNCKVLSQKDKHTFLELGFGLGDWWVFDDHWSGIYTDTTIKSYAVNGNLRYLRNFPYYCQRDNGPEGWRQCQTSSIAMVLRYLGVKGINDDVDYLQYVNKHGDTTTRPAQSGALNELGVRAEFRQNLDAQDVKEQIDKGFPVVAGICHHGLVSNPVGGGHFVVITGYSDADAYWLVQDPYGKLDLVQGMWETTANDALNVGQNLHYEYKNFDPRFFVGGKSNGWGWINFQYP